VNKNKETLSLDISRADIAATISRVKRKSAIVSAAHFTEAKK